MDNRDIIICRCEDITLAEVMKAIENGAKDLSSMKRLTRAGMGTCQGYICEGLLMSILSSQSGRQENIDLLKIRTPVFPIRMKELAELEEEDED